MQPTDVVNSEVKYHINFHFAFPRSEHARAKCTTTAAAAVAAAAEGRSDSIHTMVAAEAVAAVLLLR